METTTWIKDPDSVLDWKIDWSNWLDTAEVIQTSTWVLPTGITKDSDSHDDTSATIWLSSGVVGTTYKVTNRIVTSAGRTEDRSLTINVAQR